MSAVKGEGQSSSSSLHLLRFSAHLVLVLGSIYPNIFDKDDKEGDGMNSTNGSSSSSSSSISEDAVAIMTRYILHLISHDGCQHLVAQYCARMPGDHHKHLGYDLYVKMMRRIKDRREREASLSLASDAGLDTQLIASLLVEDIINNPGDDENDDEESLERGIGERGEKSSFSSLQNQSSLNFSSPLHPSVLLSTRLDRNASISTNMSDKQGRKSLTVEKKEKESVNPLIPFSSSIRPSSPFLTSKAASSSSQSNILMSLQRPSIESIAIGTMECVGPFSSLSSSPPLILARLIEVASASINQVEGESHSGKRIVSGLRGEEGEKEKIDSLHSSSSVPPQDAERIHSLEWLALSKSDEESKILCLKHAVALARSFVLSCHFASANLLFATVDRLLAGFFTEHTLETEEEAKWDEEDEEEEEEGEEGASLPSYLSASSPRALLKEYTSLSLFLEAVQSFARWYGAGGAVASAAWQARAFASAPSPPSLSDLAPLPFPALQPAAPSPHLQQLAATAIAKLGQVVYYPAGWLVTAPALAPPAPRPALPFAPSRASQRLRLLGIALPASLLLLQHLLLCEHRLSDAVLLANDLASSSHGLAPHFAPHALHTFLLQVHLASSLHLASLPSSSNDPSHVPFPF